MLLFCGSSRLVIDLLLDFLRDISSSIKLPLVVIDVVVLAAPAALAVVGAFYYSEDCLPNVASDIGSIFSEPLPPVL